MKRKDVNTAISFSKRLERGKAYHKLYDKVLWYYHNTDLSLQKIANHFEISYGKAAGMIERKFPKYYQEYISTMKKNCHFCKHAPVCIIKRRFDETCRELGHVADNGSMFMSKTGEALHDHLPRECGYFEWRADD